MTYRIVHKTTYTYENPVSISNHAVYLTPRSLPHHECIWNEVRVKPIPATLSDRTDYFGNQVKFFSIQEPHQELLVEARSEVRVERNQVPWPVQTPAWEDVVRSLDSDLSREGLEAYQFIYESPRVRPHQEFAQYASQSFTPGRPLADALLDLTDRIHRELRFDSKATNVRTPPEEVFRKRRGVCQDFAQLQIACLRSLHLPARYISGYLRTIPPPGRARLVGSDASHAWVSVYCPGCGWLDVDATNNVVPSEGHVTLAWGRDYSDVSPVRGMILGGGDHKLEVAVDVEPIG